MTYPLNVDLTGTIERIYDTGKVFNSNNIQKKKIMIYFTDGYQCEYTPAVHHQLTFKEGDTITYQIKFRNDKGDTIDVIHTDTGAGRPLKSPMIGSANSMAGHPAVIALSIASSMAVGYDWKQEELLRRADENLKWLLERRDLDSYTF